MLENGYFLSSEYLEVNGFKEPVLIKKAEGLGLLLPSSNFTVYDVEQHVGEFDCCFLCVSWVCNIFYATELILSYFYYKECV